MAQTAIDHCAHMAGGGHPFCPWCGVMMYKTCANEACLTLGGDPVKIPFDWLFCAHCGRRQP